MKLQNTNYSEDQILYFLLTNRLLITAPTLPMRRAATTTASALARRSLSISSASASGSASVSASGSGSGSTSASASTLPLSASVVAASGSQLWSSSSIAAATSARLPLDAFFGGLRSFSAEVPRKDSEENDMASAAGGKEGEKSLRDAVNRAKAKDGEEAADDPQSSEASDRTSEILGEASEKASSFFAAVSSTWTELVESGKPKSINKRIHDPVRDLREGEVPDDDDAAADRYEGISAVMIIDESEQLTAWERMQKRLSDAPIIQGEFGCRVCVYGSFMFGKGLRTRGVRTDCSLLPLNCNLLRIILQTL